MASTAFLANSVANSVSAEGVLKWLNELAAARPFPKKPEINVAQIAKILQNKKARDIIYHLVANTRSRNFQIEVIGNLFLQKKLSHEEIALWRDRLPELQLPDVASSEEGCATSIEPHAARHLVKKQNAFREVEQLTEQVLKSKVELMTLTKAVAEVSEKVRSASAGNALRQLYLDQIIAKCQEWKKTASDLRRRLVSAGARSAKFGSTSNQAGSERVTLAASDLTKICQKLVGSMLDDVAAVRGGTSNSMMADTSEVTPMVQKLVGEFTVNEIGAALLSNLNRAVAELEADIDRVDISAEIKELMFDYEPSTGELRDTSPLVAQPASQVMAALTLERQSALLKVGGEAAEARMDLHVLEARFNDLMGEVAQELKKWLRKDPAVLAKIERYVNVSCAVAGFEQAEKALHICYQAVDAEIRQLEARNRDASLARSRLSGFQQELENQLVQIRRLLESTASLRKEHETVSSKIGATLTTLPQSSSMRVSIVSVKDAKIEELKDFSSKNLSALNWSFSASALKRFLSTCGEIFANLPASAAKHEIGMRLLCLGPGAFLQSCRDDMVIYRCRSALLERLNFVLAQAKSSKYDDKRVRSIIDQHNTIATQNWERWSEELTQSCRDCQNAIEEGIPNYRGLINDWRSQPGQFAADWVQLDGLTYREYFRNVAFLTDSIRQREELANDSRQQQN